MATQNFFSLLGDDENDDPSHLLAKAAAAVVAPVKQQQQPQKQLPPQPAKLPSKPLPPAQAVKEAQADGARGRGSRGGRGGARGSYGNRGRGFDGGFSRPIREGGFQGDGAESNERNFNTYRNGDFQGGRGGYLGNRPAVNGDSAEDAEGGRQSDGSRGRGRGRPRGRGGFGYMGDGEERPPRREYERRSGTGRGNEVKREGAGRGNWGMEVDQAAVPETVEPSVIEEEKPALSEVSEKKPEEEIQPTSVDAEEKNDAAEEDNEMTLEEYEKVMAEKRRALEALKAEERKVTLDKDFESMRVVDKKNDDVFLKLGSDKDKGKRKEVLDKEERARKSVSINEFLKPVEGEEYYSPTGRRGRGGRGRSDRGGARGGFGGRYNNSQQVLLAPHIEDQGQFPTLGGK